MSMRSTSISTFEADIPGEVIVPCATHICLVDAGEALHKRGLRGLTGFRDQGRPEQAESSKALAILQGI